MYYNYHYGAIRLLYASSAFVTQILNYSLGKVYFKDKLPNVIIPDVDLSDLEG